MARLTWALPAAAVLALGAGVASAANFSTLDLVDGRAIYWGADNTGTYGQTFVLTHDIMLERMELEVDDGGVPVSYTMSVRSWDGTQPTGATLFTAAGVTEGVAGYRSITLDLGSLSLPDGRYVVLFEAATPGAAAFATAEEAYTEGSWVYFDAVNESWYVSQTADLGFRVDYKVGNPNPPPEVVFDATE